MKEDFVYFTKSKMLRMQCIWATLDNTSFHRIHLTTGIILSWQKNIFE